MGGREDRKTERPTAAHVATVSEVVGAGVEAHRLVRVGPWPFAAWLNADGEEPRIRDLVLARKLGYQRPRDIRKLIERYIESGDLPDVYVRATVARTLMPRGGSREAVVPEYWLTQAEALFIATKSETASAVAITKEMIDVFILARRGLLPQQNGLTPEMVADIAAKTCGLVIEQVIKPLLSEMKRELRAEIAQVRDAALHGSTGQIAGEQADWIRGEVRDLAHMRVALGKNRNHASARASLYHLVHQAARWGGKAMPIERLPSADHHRVKTCLQTLRTDMEADLRRTKGAKNAYRRHASGENAAQQTLFGRQPLGQA